MLRKKMFKKRNIRKSRNIRFCVFISFAISLLVFVDSTVSKIIGPLAIKNAEELLLNKINTIVSDTLSSHQLSYDDLIFTKTNGGEVSYVQANSVAINKLKSEMVTEIDKALDNNKNLETTVQLGSVINSSLLSNRGPAIKVYFDLYCSTNSEIVSSLTQAGLNQTLHSIKLIVTTDFCLMIINDQYFDKIITDYVVAESVIVGEVPSSYGNIYGLNT